MSIISDLIAKQIDVKSAAKMTSQDYAVISELLAGIQSSQDPIRYNSFKVILLISEDNPEFLYPHWLLFEKMLDSDNSYFKNIAIQVIANLTKIDSDNRFEKLFDKYFGELNSEKTMVAAHVAGNAGKIALTKPRPQSQITSKLINIGTTYAGKQIALIKGYTIETFHQYYDKTNVKGKDRILKFVKKEQTSRSPRTRKAALAFLKTKGIEKQK